MANCPPRNQCKPPPSPSKGSGKSLDLEVDKKKSYYEPWKIFESPLKNIGPKQIAEFKPFIPSVITWGAFSIVALLYFSDLKAITKWIPFYGGKYKKDEENTADTKGKEAATDNSGGGEPSGDHKSEDIAAAAVAAAEAVHAAADGKDEKKKANDEC